MNFGSSSSSIVDSINWNTITSGSLSSGLASNFSFNYAGTSNQLSSMFASDYVWQSQGLGSDVVAASLSLRQPDYNAVLTSSNPGAAMAQTYGYGLSGFAALDTAVTLPAIASSGPSWWEGFGNGYKGFALDMHRNQVNADTASVLFLDPFISAPQSIKNAVLTTNTGTDRFIEQHQNEPGFVWGYLALPIGGVAQTIVQTYSLPGVNSTIPTVKISAADKPLNPISTYSRPSGYRSGVRQQVWENAKGPDGLVRDPAIGRVMNFNEPWDVGHARGYEFRKHQLSAQQRGLSRQQFLDEYNHPDVYQHYRPELQPSNRRHMGENMTNDYYGP